MKRWLTLALFSALLPPALGLCDQASNELKEVTRDVYLLPGQLQSNQSPDGNSEILRGSKGLIVIDTGRNDLHTQQLIDAVAAMKLPIAGVINTHWHLDHIGGNARFKQQFRGVRIYAHPSLDVALNGFHKDYRQQLETYVPTLVAGSAEKQRYQAEINLLKLDGALAETDAVSRTTVMKLGGRKIEVHVSEHSVTEGDLWILDPATATLIAGDLVTLPAPMFDSACPEGWQHALEVLATTKFKRLIPGHGAPMTSEEFARYRNGFNNLLVCAGTPDNKEQCIDHWFDDVHSLNGNIDQSYGRALLSYYFDQFIKSGAPQRTRWCKSNQS